MNDSSKHQFAKVSGGQSFGRSLLFVTFVLLSCVFLFNFPSLIESFLIIFASSVCIVFVVTPFVIIAAHKAGAIDYPGGRRIHTFPTPRWGGIAVCAGVVAALLLTSFNNMPNLRALLYGSMLVLLAGLLDDVSGIKAWVKLLIQITACIILIMDGIHVTFLPPTWWGIAGEWLITLVWIVGITNAVNFLDGMDGLVSGLAASTSSIYFILALLLGSNMLAYCSMALFGASIAFLSFNVKPARIFLGDGGSNFLGFFLAALSIQGEWARNDPLVSFFIPILVLSVPIYDMVFTTINRIGTGKVFSFKSWLEFTGTDHIHHRLEALGLTKGWVVITICFLNMAVGLGAITLFEARTYGGIALIIQAICIYIVLAKLELLGGKRQNSSSKNNHYFHN